MVNFIKYNSLCNKKCRFRPKVSFKVKLNLSEEFQANIFLKREDLQIVRSYKLRSAFNKIDHKEPHKF
jgi:threonine dehydratase